MGDKCAPDGEVCFVLFCFAFIIAEREGEFYRKRTKKDFGEPYGHRFLGSGSTQRAQEGRGGAATSGSRRAQSLQTQDRGKEESRKTELVRGTGQRDTLENTRPRGLDTSADKTDTRMTR